MASSSGQQQQRATSPDPLNASHSSTQAQAGSLASSMTKPTSPNSSANAEPTLESLLTQRDIAMHDLCLKYCRIIQRYGASLTIAVERSFYECFYNLLSEYFRAHTTAGEWAVVGPHLESIFQAPRIRKPTVAHVLPDRRTGISSGATMVGAAAGPVGGLAGRGPGGSPGGIGPSRRMSMAIDAQGNKLLGGKAGDDPGASGMGTATGPRLAGIVSQALISNAAMAAAVVAAGAPSVNARKNMSAIAALANSTNTGPTGSGQHEVMEVIARALERKKVEDAKQREREERRKSEAKVTARENFSLRSIIHARSPLVALIMPTARDQTAKVVQAGKQILVGTPKNWHPSSELGPTSDAPPPPSAIRRAVTARAARSPTSAGKSSNARTNSVHHRHPGTRRPSTSSAAPTSKIASLSADTPDPTTSASSDPDPATSTGPRLSLPASSGPARRHSRAGSLGIPAILTSPSIDTPLPFGGSAANPTRAGALHLAIATAEEARQLAALSLGDFVEAVHVDDGVGVDGAGTGG
ncbi:hypothetical protein BCR44DRAFT_1515520 [Catenaria anguillulae PL171]|uniref:Uncharacterized protein n=1 Tax=Catenaria anguillulae PL171 TaxID=765915 RepID=A0A1Y2HCI5_9FUNG|nr:hypothetical protein BCR44DRAFT_1515520 [Catenaria anguillulae PL171]